MRPGFRVGMIGLLSGLLFSLSVAAQTGKDTERVGAETDTAMADAAGKEDTSSFTRSPDEAAVLRRIPDSAVGAWQSDKAFAYANDPEYWRRKHYDDRPNGVARLLQSRAFEIFLLSLLGAILLYAIIRIVTENNLQFFYRSPGTQRSAAPAETHRPEDDLEGKLQHFLQTKDYRQAVRYLYLKALWLLNDRGLIRYQQHETATNREYLQQLSATPQSGAFRELTLAYEKVWYGEFPLGEGAFERLHGYFEDFYKTVRA